MLEKRLFVSSILSQKQRVFRTVLTFWKKIVVPTSITERLNVSFFAVCVWSKDNIPLVKRMFFIKKFSKNFELICWFQKSIATFLKFLRTYTFGKSNLFKKWREHFFEVICWVQSSFFVFFGKHCWIYFREHLVSTSKKRKFPRTNLLVPFLNFDFFEEFEEISLFSWKSYVLQCKNCICSILFGQNCMNWLLRTLFCR